MVVREQEGPDVLSSDHDTLLDRSLLTTHHQSIFRNASPSGAHSRTPSVRNASPSLSLDQLYIRGRSIIQGIYRMFKCINYQMERIYWSVSINSDKLADLGIIFGSKKVWFVDRASATPSAGKGMIYS